MVKHSTPIPGPLLTNKINSDKMIVDLWNKFFAYKHSNIINKIKFAMKANEELKANMTQAFPGFDWPEFADMPTTHSFEALKSIINGILNVPGMSQALGVKEAIKLYMDQYDLFVKQIPQIEKQTPQEGNKADKLRPKLKPSAKIKRMQILLGIDDTGLWNKLTNDTFLSWLKTHGRADYIKDNKFTGNINYALAILENHEPSELDKRQASRLDAIKKIYNE